MAEQKTRPGKSMSEKNSRRNEGLSLPDYYFFKFYYLANIIGEGDRSCSQSQDGMGENQRSE